jgi:uncharacterized protein YraI
MKKILKAATAAAVVLTILCSFSLLSAAAAGPAFTAGIVSVGVGNLNVRSAPSTASTVLAILPNGSYVTLLSLSGGWWNVEYAMGKYGFCSAAYITQVPGSYAASVSCSLNIRSGSGTSYGIVGWLNSGDYAVVLPSSGTWAQVLWGGGSLGWVSRAYLDAGIAFTPLSLTVPSYKQTDARWAGIQVGTKGGTIGTIGCSTVALAMSESYRTGTAIYPGDMAGKLSYTAGGAVYWALNYTAYTGGDYLSVIYSLLKAGQTVLVGATDAGGGQHWVVVTGFTGGSALSAAGFTINDPGSNSRTTLQQYLSVYPNFYKLMHY